MKEPAILALCLSFAVTSWTSADDWYEVAELRYGTPPSRLYDRSDGAPGWSEAYTLRAYLSMYRARGDMKWLEYMVIRVDNLIDQMRDVPDWRDDYWPGYKDGFKGWGTVKSTKQYDEFIVHDGHVCAPIARFVKLVYSDPALQKRYKAKAAYYLETLERHIIAKWYANWGTRRGDSVFLRKWAGIPGGLTDLPHNQYLAFGTLLLVLHEIAQLPEYVPANPAFPDFYLRGATDMAQFFREDLRYAEKEDAYLWDYMKKGRREDVGHGNLDVEFAIKAYHLGIVFDRRDMTRSANTVVNVLWNKDEAKPDFRSHVDFKYGSVGKAGHLSRWLWLYEFDPKVGQLINQYYKGDPGRGFGETHANLACWQTGVHEDDYSPHRTEAAREISPRPIKLAYVKTSWTLGVTYFLETIEDTEIVPTYLTFKQIQDGELTTDNYDVVYFIGGGVASKHYGKDGELGAVGQQKVRAFVASGGGYLGICGGAYAGSHDGNRDYCMGLANVKIISSGTGDGDIEIRMEKGASEIFASPSYLPPTVRKIRHANGPLWETYDKKKPLYVVAAFTGRTGTVDFRPDHPAAQPGSFFADHPCIVCDFYGKGRVVLCSSHPELADKTTGNAAMIPEMIRWLAGNTPKRRGTDGDNDSRAEKKDLKVEKVDMLPSYCGPACIEMVLRYWSYAEHTQTQIAQGVKEGFPNWKTTSPTGVHGDQMLWYFQNKAPNGMAKRTGLYEPEDDDPCMPQPKTPEREAARRLLLEELKNHIAEGRPVIVLGHTYDPPETSPVKSGTRDFGRHYRVAVGYDETVRPPTITVVDPSTSTKERVWSEDLFMKYWDITNPASTPAQGWNLWMLVYDARSAAATRFD